MFVFETRYGYGQASQSLFLLTRLMALAENVPKMRDRDEHSAAYDAFPLRRHQYWMI